MRRALLPLTIASTVLFVFGCSYVLSPRPDESKFYVLTPVSDAGAPTGAGKALTVGLGPIRMPEYLERQEIATRVAANQIKYSATDRWAEPLDVNFRRVLEKDLAERLANAEILPFPWFAATRLDYRVTVEVSRFEQADHGNSELRAHWAIADGKTGAMLFTRDATITRHPESVGTDGLVAALSADAAELSDQIASAIRAVPEKR